MGADRGGLLRWARSAPAPENGLENAELVCKQAFVTAGTVVPVAPVDAALIAAKHAGVGEAGAQPLQQAVGLRRQADAIQRHHEMPGLRVGAAAVLIIAERVALHDVGEVRVGNVPQVAGEPQRGVGQAHALRLGEQALEDGPALFDVGEALDDHGAVDGEEGVIVELVRLATPAGIPAGALVPERGMKIFA